VTGAQLAALKGYEYAVNEAAFSPDGTRIVSATSGPPAGVYGTQRPGLSYWR
jgi:hypothetical protein